MRAEVDGVIIEVAVLQEANSIVLECQGHSFEFQLAIAVHDSGADTANLGHPAAPMSGTVVAVLLAAGKVVEYRDPLIVIDAMKMKHTIVAEGQAMVSEVLFAVGNQVDGGGLLMMLEVV